MRCTLPKPVFSQAEELTGSSAIQQPGSDRDDVNVDVEAVAVATAGLGPEVMETMQTESTLP
jgi:hypothetical protein